MNRAYVCERSMCRQSKSQCTASWVPCMCLPILLDLHHPSYRLPAFCPSAQQPHHTWPQCSHIPFHTSCPSAEQPHWCLTLLQTPSRPETFLNARRNTCPSGVSLGCTGRPLRIPFHTCDALWVSYKRIAPSPPTVAAMRPVLSTQTSNSTPLRAWPAAWCGLARCGAPYPLCGLCTAAAECEWCGAMLSPLVWRLEQGK